MHENQNEDGKHSSRKHRVKYMDDLSNLFDDINVPLSMEHYIIKSARTH